MASQNGHFLIRRVLISGLGHDENLLSNYSLLEKAASPLSLGAKQKRVVDRAYRLSGSVLLTLYDG
jgi:hypothetical protein